MPSASGQGDFAALRGNGVGISGNRGFFPRLQGIGQADWTFLFEASGTGTLASLRGVGSAILRIPANASGSGVLPAPVGTAFDVSFAPPPSEDARVSLPTLALLPKLRGSGEVATGNKFFASGSGLFAAMTALGAIDAKIPPSASGSGLLPLLRGVGAIVAKSPFFASGQGMFSPMTGQGFGIFRVFKFAVLARRPIAVDQVYGSDHYPFRDVTLDASVGDIVADLALVLPSSTSCDFVPPYSIQWMFGFGTVSVPSPVEAGTPRHGYEVRIVDAEDQLVFDSTLAGTTFSTIDWGGRLQITEWTQADRFLRLVHHTAWVDESSIIDYPVHLVPTGSTVLDDRTVKIKPASLRSLSLGSQSRVGGITLQAGYNTRIDVAETLAQPTGRLVTPIVFSAIPGEGLGTVGGCDDEGQSEGPRYIRSIGGTATSDGHYLLVGDDCTHIQPLETSREEVDGVTVVETLPGLLISSPCGPQCSCEHHLAVYKAIKRLWDQAREVGTLLSTIRNKHQQNVDRWNEEADCRKDRESLKLIVVPYCGGSVSITGYYCHAKSVCLNSLKMRLSFDLTDVPPGKLIDPEDVELPCGTVHQETTYDDLRSYKLSGTYPGYTATFNNVEPLAYSILRMQLNFPNEKIGKGTLTEPSTKLTTTLQVGGAVRTVTVSLIKKDD